MPTPDAETIQVVETLVTETVDIIRRSVELLRESFPNNIIRSNKKNRQRQDDDDSSGTPDIFSIFEQSMITDIARIRGKAKALQQHSSAEDSNPSENESRADVGDDVIVLDEDGSQKHYLGLIRQVLLPVLSTLGRCYEILDQIPTVVVQEDDTSRSRHPPSSRVRRNNRGPKPAPPAGMLSLQNYTDIACFIEFTICSTIVSNLPPNVLLNIQERIRYQLPKALAGRLPKAALLWASQQKQQKQINDRKVILDAVAVVGQLLMLDRFCPMLLPRHLTDLYAAILYVEHSNKGQECQEHGIFDHVSKRLFATTDPRMRAKTYQTLLRKGRDTPEWLRRSVSHLLNRLALEDLNSVLAVFVHPDQDATAASLRLARALIATDKKEKLCDQLIRVLDTVLLEGGSGNKKKDEGCCPVEGLQLLPQHVASIETVWAVLDVMPDQIVTGYWKRRMVDNNDADHHGQIDSVGEKKSKIHRSIRRWGIMFAVPPRSHSSLSKVGPLFLGCSTGENTAQGGPTLTFLGALLRLASTSTVLASTIKADAIWLLCLYRDAMLEVKIREDCEASDILATMFLYCVAPCEWDLAGCRYDITSEQGKDDGDFVPIPIQRDTIEEDFKMRKAAKDTENRARLLIKDILLKDIRDSEHKEEEALAAFMFQILVTMYFKSMNLQSANSISLPSIWKSPVFRILPLVCLPMMCELFPPDTLLSPICGHDGVFAIMEVVFASAESRFCNEAESLETEPNWSGSVELISSKIDSSTKALLSFLGHAAVREIDTQEDHGISTVDDEMVLSMTSILLSLLLGILEMGTKQRSGDEEKYFRSFASILTSLAKPVNVLCPESLVPVLAQMAEMSSHAIALIAARGADKSIERQRADDMAEKRTTIEKKILEAEEDLASSEPPIRARGVVRLRHLANTIGDERKKREKGLVVLENEDQCDHLQSILHLSLKALADQESYVYLAAIHTIVALVDADSVKFVPLVGTAVTTGIVRQSKIYRLSLEQRAKLIEALVFVVRQRGSFDSELLILLELLVFGPDYDVKRGSDADNDLIQDLTDQYFAENTDVHSEEMDKAVIEEYWKERDIRIRTGGPLFESEEDDVIRAGKIALVAELTSVLSPDVVARYCFVLVDCCIDTLRLEVSRPVRRAGASLARELYAALLREQDNALASASRLQGSEVPMAMEMVQARQDVLQAVLRRCVKAKDLEKLANGLERKYDHATVARCQEALTLQERAMTGGILAAGYLAVQSKLESEGPVAGILQKSMQKDNSSKPTRTISIDFL